MAKSQLNFRIEAEKRDRWEQHINDRRRYDKLSQFIKDAVEEKIDRDSSERVAVPDVEVPSDGHQDGRIDDVLEELRDLRARFEDVEDAATTAADAAHAQSGVSPDLAPDVFEALPVGEGDAMTAEDLARKSGWDLSATRFALENLRRNTGTVRKVVDLEDREGNRETVVGRGDAENVMGDMVGDPRWFKTEGA
jgi:hypothetical protein